MKQFLYQVQQSKQKHEQDLRYFSNIMCVGDSFATTLKK
jgi:hypothetical protein